MSLCDLAGNTTDKYEERMLWKKTVYPFELPLKIFIKNTRN